MKKLFISVPMKDRTAENIRKSMEKMHKIAEAVWGQELEVIPSFIEDKPPKDAKQSIWYLGKSIQLLADADYFIGVEYGDYSGCDVELEAATRYVLPVYTLPLLIAAPDTIEDKRCRGETLRFHPLSGGGAGAHD